MNVPPSGRLEEQVIGWAREAGDLALAAIRPVRELTFKTGREVVTDADRRGEELLRDRIAAAFPADAVLGEELGARGDTVGADRVWHLDPIDGTLNYALGLPDWCVSIALVEGGSLRAACVHQPATGDVWSATRGAGTRRNGRAVRVSSRDRLGDAIVSIQVRKRGRFGRRPHLLQALLLESFKTRKVGAVALEMAWVAAGAYDAMVIGSGGPIPFHDVAAGLLLIGEAGGTVTDVRGRPYAAAGGELVAGNAGVQRDLLALVDRFPDEGSDS
jgi:myo-inositol-1(or 4)-monophosphatase